MKGINLKDFNKKVHPGDDFFEYVSGGWVKRNPIPASETRWGSFYVLAERNMKALHSIVDGLLKKKHKQGTNEQKVADFYFSAMDTARINREGIKPLQKELDRVQSANTLDDLFATVAYHHLIDSGCFWYTSIEPDDKNSERIVVRLYQHGLGLPDRDYYTRTDAKSLELKSKYISYVQKLFRLMGRGVKDAEGDASIILEIETRLARASMTAVERRDVHGMYNTFSMAKLKRSAPHIPWELYFKELGIKNLKNLIVSQPKFIEELESLVTSTLPDHLKTYMTWHLVNAYAGYLSAPFEKASFEFYGKILSGAQKMKPRWKRAIGMVDDALGEALGKLFVEKYFPPAAKRRMMELIENVRTAFRERIKNLDWMSAATKKKALAKLSAIVYKIGYPDKWLDYGKLEITRDSLVLNAIAASLFDSRREIAKLGKPVDRKEWHMTPPTVNAYFSPNMNEIVFPAGILQPPYFSMTADDAVNYGAIGSIIGHELTHGFDDEGSHFDAKGNLKKWWTTNDRKKFMQKAKMIEKQFDAYVAIDDLHVNGKLTLGENIADLGGLAIAYDAFVRSHGDKEVRKIDGLTALQRFFIGFAIGERNVTRPEVARMRVLTDPHSPPRYRVNGAVTNMDEFYDAFHVTPDKKLFKEPQKRAKIW